MPRGSTLANSCLAVECREEVGDFEGETGQNSAAVNGIGAREDAGVGRGRENRHGLRQSIDLPDLANAGLEFSGTPSPDDTKRIAGIFAKADASPDGRIRGRRTTMLSDADINYERHARAALGAVIASITNDPAIFVSGGTEHQCGPGAAPIAANNACYHLL